MTTDEWGRRVAARRDPAMIQAERDLKAGLAADAARDRRTAIVSKRDGERVRRDHLRALRKAVSDAGYPDTIRLSSLETASCTDGTRYEMSISTEKGIANQRMSRTVGATAMPATREMILQAGLHMVDLALLARRRNAAIIANGGCPTSPPAWAFLVHPVIRALLTTITDDPQRFRPLDEHEWRKGMRFSPTHRDMRIGYTNVRVRSNAGWLMVDAGNQMARIRTPGVFPETLLQVMPGKPLGSIIDLPGLGLGTLAGDSIIRDAWQETDSLYFTVSCPLVPMADAPEGTDVAFLTEWLERHVE